MLADTGLMNQLDLQADLCARQVVIASMLYYSLDLTIMPDGEYDKLAKRVSASWDRLSPMRRWMLGKDAHEIAASGFQVKITQLAADAAVTLIRARKLIGPALGICITRPWRFDKRQGLSYLRTNEFRIVETSR